MKKSKILILYARTFRDFNYKKLEIGFLEKIFKLEIHEFVDVFFPNQRKLFNNEMKYSGRNLHSFNSIESWKNYLTKLINEEKKNNNHLFVLNFINIFNYNFLKILFFLNEREIDYLNFFNYGIPTYDKKPKNFNIYSHYKQKFMQVIFRPRFAYETLKAIVLNFIFYNLIVKYFIKKKQLFLTAGSQYRFLRNDENSKIILGNSWDYSEFIRKRKFRKTKTKKNYAVYLSTPGPGNISDSNLLKTKVVESVENWYSSLDLFFKKIEKIFNLKVIIALNPKIRSENVKYFKKRKAYYNKTLELVRDAKFVIGQMSTATSYAVIFKKPIFFIYSNETKKDPRQLKHINFWSKILNTTPININSNLDEKMILKLKKISKKSYENYISRYLTSRKGKKANFQIIQELIESRR